MADTSPLYAAMALAFTELEGALKTSNNPHFKNNYADLSSVIDAIKPALVKHGLFFWQVSHDTPDGAMIETVIGHKSGGERSLGKLFIPASKKDAHGFGSALTYARRYALMAAFGIPAEDDDGNAASLGQGKGQSQTGAVSPSLISKAQADELGKIADEVAADKVGFCTYFNVTSMAALPASRFDEARAMLERKRKVAA